MCVDRRQIAINFPIMLSARMPYHFNLPGFCFVLVLAGDDLCVPIYTTVQLKLKLFVRIRACVSLSCVILRILKTANVMNNDVLILVAANKTDQFC